MHLLVVGAGEMGRWFARTAGADAVAFADRDPAVAEAAAAALSRDGPEADDRGPAQATAAAVDGEERYDVVCVAVPMPAVPDAIAEQTDRAREAVVDVSGEMRDSVAALREHAGGLERASFHPLFAAANAPGNVPVVVDRDGPRVEAIRGSLEAAGNRVFETSPAAHDRAMETVQARAHAAVLAYALVAEEVDPRFHTTLSAPLAELVEQLTGDDPDVYAHIQERFPGADGVAEAARELAEADPETFRARYEEAGR